MRAFVLAVVFLLAVAATASAQQPKPTNTSVTPSANAAPVINVFNKSAIDRAVAGTISTTPATAAAAKFAPVPRSGKSFWKSPWPYIIAGGVAAAIIIGVNAGNNNGTGGGY
jgi:hypothetical protein